MKFLKKIGRKLFGSSKPKKALKPKGKASKKISTKQSKKKALKSAKKRTGKKAASKPKSKPSKKKANKPANKKTTAKKMPRMITSALAAFPTAEVTHYFPHVNAAVLRIKVGEIRIGDELHIKGHTTDFMQKVVSMQIDHEPVMIARKGDDFGVEVKSRVRAGDLVFKK
jgi:putative protease